MQEMKKTGSINKSPRIRIEIKDNNNNKWNEISLTIGDDEEGNINNKQQQNDQEKKEG